MAGYAFEFPRQLSGRGLVAARVAWGAVALLSLIVFVASLSVGDAVRAQASPSLLTLLAESSIPAAAFPMTLLLTDVFFTSVAVLVAVVLFWRKSDDGMVFFVSLFLVAFGVVAFSPLDALATREPIWRVPVIGVEWLSSSMLVLFCYLFPNGRFVPRWTKPLSVAWIVVCFLWSLRVAVPGIAQGAFGVLFVLVSIAYWGTAIGAQVYRYAHVSSAVERRQSRWLVFGWAGACAGGILYLLLQLLFPRLLASGAVAVVANVAALLLLALALLLIPVSVGLAVLRYRLWDIDPIINRSLVYALLTGILALVYGAGIFLFQTIFRVLTGQESDLAIVASTLVSAALIHPMRGGVQQFIDRRFYRRKYDAEQVLETFSATLRDEPDLERLTAELLAVVEETMHPAHISLWLRQPPGRRGNLD